METLIPVAIAIAFLFVVVGIVLERTWPLVRGPKNGHFRTSFYCYNCNSSTEMDFPIGTEIRRHGKWYSAQVWYPDTPEKPQEIYCSKCGSNKIT